MWTKKPLERQRNFKTVFSLYFKLQEKNFTPQNHSLFGLHLLFRRDQSHYSKLTSKIIKMCEHILKKDSGPNTIQILWIAKKQRYNSPLRSWGQLLISIMK